MKVRQIVVICYFGLAAFGIMLIIYWVTFGNVPPVTVHSVRVMNQPIEPGSVMNIRYVYEKPYYCPGTITRKITGCGLYDIGTLKSTAPISLPGQMRVLNIYVKTPTELPPAQICKYGSIAEWRCNPLHHIWPLHQEFPSAVFQVATDDESIQKFMRDQIEKTRNNN